jgi:hypothetical protein
MRAVLVTGAGLGGAFAQGGGHVGNADDAGTNASACCCGLGGLVASRGSTGAAVAAELEAGGAGADAVEVHLVVAAVDGLRGTTEARRFEWGARTPW